MKQNEKCKRHVKYKRINFAPCNKSIMANTRVDIHRSKKASHTISYMKSMEKMLIIENSYKI